MPNVRLECSWKKRSRYYHRQKDRVWRSLNYLKKSFMKIINNKGPSIDPCQRPQSIHRRSEILSLLDTCCCLSDKYDRNQLKAIPRTQYEINFWRRILWSTQSNALQKSRNIEATILNRYEDCHKWAVKY